MLSRRDFLATTALVVTPLGATALSSSQNLDEVDDEIYYNRPVYLVYDKGDFVGAIVGYDLAEALKIVPTMFNSINMLVSYPSIIHDMLVGYPSIIQVEKTNRNMYNLWSNTGLRNTELRLMDMLSGDFQPVLEHALKAYPNQFVFALIGE